MNSSETLTDTGGTKVIACVSPQVQKHLSKLFDSLSRVKFEADGEGNPTKTAVGMYSKEEEYVPFDHPCDCSGQVTHPAFSFLPLITHADHLFIYSKAFPVVLYL